MISVIDYKTLWKTFLLSTFTGEAVSITEDGAHRRFGVIDVDGINIYFGYRIKGGEKYFFIGKGKARYIRKGRATYHISDPSDL